jgi:hypothetical protein
VLREFYGPLVARLDIEVVSDTPIHFASVARAASDLALSGMAFSPVLVGRTRAPTADGNDSCVLSHIHSPGNTVILSRARIRTALLSMADPFQCRTLDGIAQRRDRQRSAEGAK